LSKIYHVNSVYYLHTATDVSGSCAITWFFSSLRRVSGVIRGSQST